MHFFHETYRERRAVNLNEESRRPEIVTALVSGKQPVIYLYFCVSVVGLSVCPSVCLFSCLFGQHFVAVFRVQLSSMTNTCDARSAPVQYIDLPHSRIGLVFSSYHIYGGACCSFKLTSFTV